MPAATNLMLGVILGTFAATARVDHVWYRAILSQVPAGSLKSVVMASQRSEAEAFYRVWSKAPVQFEYYLIGACILILLSFVGGATQFPHKRMGQILSFGLFSGAVGVYALLARPLLIQFQVQRSRKVEELSQLLYSLAFYQAISGILVLLTTFVQVSLDEQEEEVQAANAARKKKD